MRFIVDAQLPRLLTDHLVASGHEAVHVKQLPKAGGTSDADSAFADLENRIVVTKDTDFQESTCSVEPQRDCCAWPPATSGTQT